jgi:hypothetical protein
MDSKSLSLEVKRAICMYTRENLTYDLERMIKPSLCAMKLGWRRKRRPLKPLFGDTKLTLPPQQSRADDATCVFVALVAVLAASCWAGPRHSYSSVTPS